MSERPYTILCSIYDSSVQLFVGRILSTNGYDHITVQNGKEAEEHVQSADLVISDVTNGGYELLRYVRDQRDRLPFIFLAGAAVDPDQVAATCRDMEPSVLQKPFQVSELEELVRNSLA